MARIFISYRREDSPGHAGRLFDRLRAHFGADGVFMDVAGIEAGIDFADAIDRAVSSADILLAVIGPKWATCTDRKGRRRLDDPGDFIRLEVATALSRKVRVVPVLVEDADVPAAEVLPDDLKPLSRRQAVELRDARWDADVADLITALEGTPGGGRAGAFSWTDTSTDSRAASNRSRLLWRWAVAAVVVLGLGLVVAAPWRRPSEDGGPAKRIVVPLVIGQPLNEAVARLESVGLAAGVRTGKRSLEQPPGRVLEQSPSSGAKVDPGTAVALIYAEASATGAQIRSNARGTTTRAGGNGPVEIEMPDLRGLDLAEAEVRVQALKLSVGSREAKDAPQGRVNEIVDQSPAPGSHVSAGARVTLVYALDTRIEVPDFVGTDVRKSTDTIRGLGLKLTRQITRSAEVPPYQVVRQEPAARTRVSRGAPVVLVYAQLPPAMVPDVVGRPLEEARAKLSDAKIKVRRVVYEETSAARAGFVTRQSLRAGDEVGPETSAIDLVVARAPALPHVCLYYYAIEDRQATEDLAAYLRKTGLPVEDYVVKEGRGTPPSTNAVAYPSPDARDVAQRLADSIYSQTKRATGQSTRVDLQLEPSPKPYIYVRLSRHGEPSSGWTLLFRKQLSVKAGDVLDLDSGRPSAPPKADISFGTTPVGSRLAPLGRASLAIIRGSGVAACVAARFGTPETNPDKLSWDTSVCVRTDLRNMSVLQFSRDGRSGLLQMRFETWAPPAPR